MHQADVLGTAMPLELKCTPSNIQHQPLNRAADRLQSPQLNKYMEYEQSPEQSAQVQHAAWQCLPRNTYIQRTAVQQNISTAPPRPSRSHPAAAAGKRHGYTEAKPNITPTLHRSYTEVALIHTAVAPPHPSRSCPAGCRWQKAQPATAPCHQEPCSRNRTAATHALLNTCMCPLS